MEFHNNKDSIFCRKKQERETAKTKNFHLDFHPARFLYSGNGRTGGASGGERMFIFCFFLNKISFFDLRFLKKDVF